MYIGITKQKPELRWKSNGCGYKMHVYFWNAIQKYGWDNFEHEIVASGLTKEEAGNFEKLLIKKLDTTNDEHGYNLDKGGTYGLHSEASKDKMRGKNNPASRKVICITDGKIFDTAVEGAKYYGIKRESVRDCCSKRQYSCNNKDGINLKWMYYDEYLKNGYTTLDAPDNNKKVICLETNKIYNSLSDTANDFNVSPSTISNCCSLNCLSITKNNIKYHFMLYEYFLKYGKIDFEKIKKNSKVIHIPNKKIYKSITKASKDVDISYFIISKKCRRMYYMNEESDWMYYEDFLKLNHN